MSRSRRKTPSRPRRPVVSSRLQTANLLATAAQAAGRHTEAHAINLMARGCKAEDVGYLLALHKITLDEFTARLREYAAFIRGSL